MLTDSIEYTGRAKDYAEELEKAMATVFDPEMGIDVVNLGLIYRVDLDDEGVCKLDYTFTSMGCSCAVDIQNGLHKTLNELDFVSEVKQNVVWDPAWTLNRITRYGRIALGINPGNAR